MWNKSPSSQSRASRNARLCQSVFRYAPHRQPQTREAESLRCTPLPVYVGPRRSGQSLPPVPSATALRRPNSHVGMSEGWCSNSTVCASSRTPFYLASTASRREPAAAYGLAPYAICVRLQHRPSDERPLQPRCELQRHHPQEGRLRVYIYLFFGSSRAAARPISYVIH